MIITSQISTSYFYKLHNTIHMDKFKVIKVKIKKNNKNLFGTSYLNFLQYINTIIIKPIKYICLRLFISAIIKNLQN